MAFAPSKKKSTRSGSSTPRHRVPNIKVPSKDKGRAVKVPNVKIVEDYSKWPLMAADGPMPVCWLCSEECGTFGWPNMPSELSTPTGAALNYFTLCPRCTALLSQHNMTNSQVMAECSASGHSDAFITFLREYKILLELIAVEKAKAASVTQRKDTGVCYDLGVLRRLLSCVDGTLTTYGLTTREKGLLGVELSNLQEQAQIVSNKKSNPPSGQKLNLPGSIGGSYSGERDERLTTPLPFQDDVSVIGAWDPRSVNHGIHTPVMPPNMPPSLPYSVPHSVPSSLPMDMDFSFQLQEEITRLQQSNSEALQKLSMLSRQHKELSAAYETTLDTLRNTERERDMLREREAALAAKCQQLAAQVAGRKRNPAADTEGIITELRQRVFEAERELARRPEASRDEIRQSQEARMQAVHEANQLRKMNARIGERLHQVEEELYMHRRSGSGSPLVAPMGALLSSEISLLSSEVENWETQASPPEPTLRPETTVSASPVRRDAPSPCRHESRVLSPPPKPSSRQVMWADASGNMVSFEMDPHAEREAF
eukprot:TRINITY_DN16442_c0_g1_i1.p1 TRINITY_DN16442_c0_g1~~TRINITY_DN16442_c0_g1_i1.p1  ORF type:complete len:541 (+),score=131.50 TRINITY_DN16442_c0_g1_i1:109-1731(+)